MVSIAGEPCPVVWRLQQQKPDPQNGDGVIFGVL